MAINAFTGEIRMFGGNFAPRGWALCNGQLLDIGQNSALFALLGTTYGGDGQANFALPDLRGRLPVHPGQGPGLSNHDQGEAAGSETVTLVQAQIPPHTHSLMGSQQTATDLSPGGKVPAVALKGGYAPPPTAPETPVPLAPQSVGPGGGSQPHDNLMPYLCVNFIICLDGIFPSRN